jgi:hypothetical protein
MHFRNSNLAVIGMTKQSCNIGLNAIKVFFFSILSLKKNLCCVTLILKVYVTHLNMVMISV